MTRSLGLRKPGDFFLGWTMKILSIVGKSNSGKTTLITKIIKDLKKEDLKIASIKEAGPKFDPDLKGSDSYRHRQAGADGVALYNDEYFQIVEKRELSIYEIIDYFKGYDLIILEGFKNEDIPKMEIIRKANSSQAIFADGQVLAYISDIENLDSEKPVLDLNNLDQIMDFIRNHYKI